MRHPDLQDSLVALAKLGVCGATIFAIGWCFLTLNPGGDVDESTALISDLNLMERSNTDQFEAALDQLGHSEPASYDYNGNRVFFSTKTTRKSPAQVLLDYQDEFVRQGLNEDTYTGFPTGALKKKVESKTVTTEDLQPSLERTEALLSGQIVPSAISPDYVAMGGGVLEGDPDNREEFRELMAEQKMTGNFEDIFKGYRYVEAFRNKSTGKTNVTASWSDENLDIKKHMPDKHPDTVGARPDPNVPACMGCKRINRFKGLDNEKPYTLNTFSSSQSPQDVVGFYDQAMRKRGWEPTPSSLMLGEVLQYTNYQDFKARTMQFNRGDQFITLMIYPDSQTNGTIVTANQTD